MEGYIQIAIRKVKAVDVAEMKALKKNGHRTIRFKLKLGAPKEKVPTASVPLSWIIECRERYDLVNKKDETIFKGFVSDWITGWVL